MYLRHSLFCEGKSEGGDILDTKWSGAVQYRYALVRSDRLLNSCAGDVTSDGRINIWKGTWRKPSRLCDFSSWRRHWRKTLKKHKSCIIRDLFFFRKISVTVKVKVKVKQFLYRPGQALRVSGVWGSLISGQSTHEGGKVVSPTDRPPLPHQEIVPVLHCL